MWFFFWIEFSLRARLSGSPQNPTHPWKPNPCRAPPRAAPEAPPTPELSAGSGFHNQTTALSHTSLWKPPPGRRTVLGRQGLLGPLSSAGAESGRCSISDFSPQDSARLNRFFRKYTPAPPERAQEPSLRLTVVTSRPWPTPERPLAAGKARRDPGWGALRRKSAPPPSPAPGSLRSTHPTRVPESEREGPSGL